MSLEDPTDKEQTYLNEIGKHGCSRVVSMVLLTAIFYIVGINFIPSPLNTWIFIGLALWSLIKISAKLTDYMLGPFPKPPEALKR